MSKKVVVISTSPRRNGNSEVLADAFAKGAKDIGHHVEMVHLYDKQMEFCKGCLQCQKSGKCILKDDVEPILNKMENADVIVYATPIYFYQMCGQMKTFLDRSNPLFSKPYAFRDIYLLTTAADSEIEAMKSTTIGVQGWVDCFENTQIKGIINAMNVTSIGDMKTQSKVLQEAYEMGKHI